MYFQEFLKWVQTRQVEILSESVTVESVDQLDLLHISASVCDGVSHQCTYWAQTGSKPKILMDNIKLLVELGAKDKNRDVLEQFGILLSHFLLPISSSTDDI